MLNCSTYGVHTVAFISWWYWSDSHYVTHGLKTDTDFFIIHVFSLMRLLTLVFTSEDIQDERDQTTSMGYESTKSFTSNVIDEENNLSNDYNIIKSKKAIKVLLCSTKPTQTDKSYIYHELYQKNWLRIQMMWYVKFTSLWCSRAWLKRQNSLQWRHNGRDSVSNHQPHDCLLNRLFRHRSKKI